jgi:magnesium-transporting ATPase (P-type)
MENENKSEKPIIPIEEKAKEKEIKSSWFNQSLFIFLIPAIGYSIAFMFELSFFDYFKMPTDLIEITISNLFSSILFAILVSFYFIFSIYLRFYINHKITAGIKIKLLVFSIALVLIIIYMACVSYSFRNKNYYLLLLLLGISLLLIPFLYKYHEKFKSQRNFNFKILFFYTIFLSFMLLTLFIAGKISAERQSKFFVINDSEEKIVLRIYNDILICAPFDRANKKIFLNFSIKKTSENSISLKLEKVGPLKPIGYDKNGK